MGTNNKQRRAAKKRRERERGKRSAPSTVTGPGPSDRTALVIEIVLHALEIGPDARMYDSVIQQLDRQPAARDVIDLLYTEQLDNLWANGWTPQDIVHVVARAAGANEVLEVSRRLVVDGQRLEAAGRSVHTRWRQFLHGLAEDVAVGEGLLVGDPAAESVRASVGALHAISSLPGISVVLPPPGDVAAGLPEGTHIDARMLTRVRALLAQAESTTYEEEAEAFMAKAQELIARHAIDEARLHTVDDIGEPSWRRLHLEDPYAQEKANVIAAVGTANRCRVVWDTQFLWATVIGYDHDLDAVELIGTSLLAQATAAMLRHGSTVDPSGRSRTRSFRRSFILGFAQRIGERLRRATDDQVADAAAPERFVPVLAARNDHVDRAIAREFPTMSKTRTTISNGEGWFAGQDAADEARLDATNKPLAGG